MAKPTNRCDVFLSHASSDKPAIERIALRLQEKGVSVWLDKWNLIPGEPWQPAIEEALGSCASVAVFIGPKGLAPWHHEEMRAAIQRRVAEPHFRVIPVLLAGAPPEERNKLPLFLKATTWVEFPAEDDGEAMRKLICGIRGEAPGPAPTGAMPLHPTSDPGSRRRLALMLGIALAAAALLIIGNRVWHREPPASPTTPVGAAVTPPTSPPVVGAETGIPLSTSLPLQQAIADGDAGRTTDQATLKPAQPTGLGAPKNGTVVQTAAANGPDSHVEVGPMNVKRRSGGDTTQEAKATNGGTVKVESMNYDDTGASSSGDAP